MVSVIADERVLEAVARADRAIRDVTEFVHAHPELAHEERECARHIAATLEHAGFEVERGVAGLDTAFRATLSGSAPGRAVGVVALYDAVAAVREDGSIEAVHSCGHGPIAGGVVGAALALAGLKDELPGRFVVVGCPADEIHAPGTREIGGGKALTAEAGVWDDLDAALYAHPEFIDTVSQQSRWMQRRSLLVSGLRSLEGKEQLPLAAAARLLDAVAARPGHEVMLERLVLDGDVEEGTGLVLRADVLLFADEESGLEVLARELEQRVGAGTWSTGRTIEGVRPDPQVTSAVADAFRAAGREFVDDPPPLPFATDFGNISRRVPAALIGVGRPGGWAFHTDEGAAQFRSEAGHEAAVSIAQVIALAAVRLLDGAAG